MESKIKHINRKLKKEYKTLPLIDFSDPIDALVFFILTTKVTEKIYFKTHAALKNEYSSLKNLAEAKIKEIANTIKAGGKQNQKAKCIKSSLSKIKKDYGEYSLSKLKNRKTKSIEEYLLDLPGVGLKVARCCLLFAYNRKVFPVDSHCYRISKRIGFMNGEENNKKAADIIQNKIPPQYRYSMHVNFISHGRKICTAINPKCNACVIIEYCGRNL